MKFSISLLTIIVIVNSDYYATVTPKNWEIKRSIGCPCGLIEMWYGYIEAIPPGFQLCDGTNATPDLRNKFVIGAGLDFDLGAMGGYASIPIELPNMPSHKHEINNVETSSDNHYHTTNFKAGSFGDHYHGVNLYTTDAGEHTHDATITLLPESEHVHNIPELSASMDGYHDHQMQAFIDNDYATNKVAGVKAEWVLDADQPLVDKTVIDHDHVSPDHTAKSEELNHNGKGAPLAKDSGHKKKKKKKSAKKAPVAKHSGHKKKKSKEAPLTKDIYPKAKIVIDRVLPNGIHSHVVPHDTTESGSYHTHDVEGYVDTNPGHKHDVTGATESYGEHYHDVVGTIEGGTHNHGVSGYSEYVGYDAPIDYLPPYYSVYYICCIRQPLYDF